MHVVEERVRQAKSSRRGRGSWPARLWVFGEGEGGPTKAGPAVPGLIGSDSSLSHPTGSQRFLSLEATSRAQPGRERFRVDSVGETPWTPASNVPLGEGGGAGPRRGASPGTPGRAPGGQSRPLPPRLPRGAHPSTGGGRGGARGRHPAHFPRAPPPRIRAPRSAAQSLRTLLRAPAGSQHAEGPSTRAPQTPGGRAGRLGPGRTSSAPAAQVRPRARKLDPRASGLLRCAPRR